MAFDMDRYLDHAGRLSLEGLDLERGFADRPLEPGDLRCLQYMHDIEHHTVCYLRDVLVTEAHRDPDVTAFLTMWNFEEHWHGEAIGRVLAAHGRPAGQDRIGQVRHDLGRGDRWRPLAFMVGSAVLPDLTAVHMTWGAINEWTTQAAYALLARRADHPVLSELLRRIMRQEGSHIDFYSHESRRRLARSGATRRLTRLGLSRYWHPVGHKVRPDEEVRFIMDHLFSGPEGHDAAERIDRHVDRLPGLSGLHLVTTAMERYRATPTLSVAA